MEESRVAAIAGHPAAARAARGGGRPAARRRVAGLVALEARGTARRQATSGVAQRLGAQALIEPRLDRALFLAREGVNLDDSTATRGNLLATFLRAPAASAVLRGGGDSGLGRSALAGRPAARVAW